MGGRISRKWFDGLIERVSEASSNDELFSLLIEAKKHFDADHIVYASAIPISYTVPQMIILPDYPTEWFEIYKENNYIEIDPVVEKTKLSCVPIVWHEIDDMSKEQEEMMELAKEYGLRDGISFPIHGAGGGHGILSLAFKSTPKKMKSRLASIAPNVQYFANHLHENAVRIAGLSSGGIYMPVNSISDREKDILTWLAEGKTSWEMSKILNQTESSINTTIKKSIENLSASSRMHAVSKAISLKIIHPKFYT